MSETVYHIHQGANQESVKIEKNSRGFNYEVKAASVERALELSDHLAEELKKREDS
jgi:hypothetical protein